MAAGAFMAKVFKGFGSGIFTVLSKFRISILLIVFGIIFAQAVIVSVQERSITPGFQKIAGEFVLATDKLNTHSLEVIEGGGIYDKSLGFWKSKWEFLKDIWNYVESVVIIYFWMKLLMLICLGITMDTSKRPIAWVFAVLIFFLTQPLFIVLWGEQLGGTANPWVVFLAFKNFAFSLPFIFKPLSSVAERFAKDNPGTVLPNITK